MNSVSRKELDESVFSALRATEACLERSHCPHSRFRVAAGLLLTDGSSVLGVNYESDSYGLTLCAERAAIARAQAEGKIDGILAIVIAARPEDRGIPAEPLSPCGACRQWIAELAARLDRDIPVYSFWDGAGSGTCWTARELLPGAFGLDPGTAQ